MRASLILVFCVAAAPLLAADGDWTRQGEVSLVSRLVERGVERAGAAITPAARVTDERWKLAAQVATPFDAARRTELGLSGGYSYALESGARFGVEVAHHRFGGAPAGYPSRETELTASLSLPVGPGRCLTTLTRDIDRRADIGELSYAGEYALKSWGAFLNYRVYLGSVHAENVLPELAAAWVADSYTYHGVDFTLPYRVGGQTVLAAGVHFAGTDGARPFWSPSGPSPGGKIWFSLAASYEF